MLYGRFTRNMPYHKKVNAVALISKCISLDPKNEMMYNISVNKNAR
jgi:hypothetical protein